MAGLFSALAGWFFLADLAVVMGFVTARWFILPPAGQTNPSTGDWLYREAARLGRLFAAFLPLLMILLLVRQMGEFRDPYAPFSEDLALLLGTSWGEIWLAGLVAAFLAPGGFSLAVSGRRIGWWMASAGSLVLAAFPGLTGHAGGVESPLRFFSLGADALHVLAAGAWMGGLAAILMLDRRWHRTRPEGAMESLLPVLVPPFSLVAIVGVGTLVLTGTFASWLHLSAPSALWNTDYGHLLLLKVFLVALVLGFGAWNWKRQTPRLDQHDAPPSLTRSAALELGLGTLVLLVTAILVRSSPLGS